MRSARVFLIVLLALSVVGVAAAGAAKPQHKKATFKPQAGAYTGTAKNSAGSTPATAEIAKSGGKTLFHVAFEVTLSCSDGTTTASTFAVLAEIKNNAVNYSVTGSDKNVYKLNGKFTSTTIFSGTASQEGPRSIQEADSPTCSSGKVTLSLKKKK